MYFNKGEHKSYLHRLYLLPKGSGSGRHTDAGLYLAGFVGTVSGVEQVDFVRRGWWRWAFDVVGGGGHSMWLVEVGIRCGWWRWAFDVVGGWVFDIVGGRAFDMVGGQAFDVVGGWAFSVVGGWAFGVVGGWAFDVVGGRMFDIVGAWTSEVVHG